VNALPNDAPRITIISAKNKKMSKRIKLNRLYHTIYIEISSEKIYNISDEINLKDGVKMTRPKHLSAIKERIEQMDKGSVFTTSDFLDIASTNVVNKALSRLNEEGAIRRLLQGVYEYPKYSDLLKEFVVANPERIAEALARKYNWTIGPCGDMALNLLHLSTQVTNVWSYVSDGPNREYNYGNTKISFKKFSNREISGRSYITILTIQALKIMGKDNVTDKDILKLKAVLKNSDKVIILQEAKTAPAWIFEKIKLICGEAKQL